MANTTNLDLVKPLGTDHALISVINGNMDKVDAYAGKVNDSLAGVQDGLAIVAVGDTHAAITSGQFVYVKEHNTLPEGLYTASADIAANGALTTSNLTADSKGGLNAFSDSLACIQDGLAIVAVGDTHGAITAGQFVYVKNHSTLQEGLYTASANIAANATLSGSNLTADSKGGLNALSEHLASMFIQETLTKSISQNSSSYDWYGNYVYTFQIQKTGYKLISATVVSLGGCGKAVCMKSFEDNYVDVLSLGGAATGTGTFKIIAWYIKS